MSADLATCQMDSKRLESEHRQWRIAALRHVAALERLLHQTTMSVPDRPDELL
jgi:hypothetical protein